jgi:hypothetical protein
MSDSRLSRDCKQSVTMKAPCDRCRVTPATLHLPLLVHGWYCPNCCPCCNPPGCAPTAPTVPPAPTTIIGGKFAGSLISSLSDSDLGEAHRATSRDDGPMQRAIAAERRRRWSSARRQRVLTKRHQSAQRRRGVVSG